MFLARTERTILATKKRQEVLMTNPARSRGFSLIEMLFVLAVIGILGAIAIPSYLGQRHRARVIGDAMANAKVLQMGLESLKADTGTYGVAGVYQWTANGAALTGPALIPTFTPNGNSKMDFTVTIGPGGVTYLLDVFDPTMAEARVYGTNQLGQELFRWY
jgi:prepilin-type N-terminal cleavage/methylation domain-containing protein